MSRYLLFKFLWLLSVGGPIWKSCCCADSDYASSKSQNFKFHYFADHSFVRFLYLFGKCLQKETVINYFAFIKREDHFKICHTKGLVK